MRKLSFLHWKSTRWALFLLPFFLLALLFRITHAYWFVESPLAPHSTPLTVTVTAADDTDDGTCDVAPGHCSLREALNAINTNQDDGTVLFADNFVITVTTSLPAIQENTTINGAGHNVHIIGDGPTTKLFSVVPNTSLSLANLTFTHTYYGVQLSAPVDMFNGGNLSLNNVVVRDSSYLDYGFFVASLGGGTSLAVDIQSTTFRDNTGYGYSSGGFTVSGGTLNVNNSLFEHNNGTGANGYGTAMMIHGGGPALISNTIFRGNFDNQAYRGPIRVDGARDLIIGNSLFEDNCTFTNCATPNGGGRGGAISWESTGTLTINASHFEGNQAAYFGGAIYPITGTVHINDSSFVGNAVTNSAQGNGGGAIYNTGATVVITNTTFATNASAFAGGAIGNKGSLALLNSTLSDNTAFTIGGGIETMSGTLTLENTIVAGNHAPASDDVDGSVVSQGHNLVGTAVSGISNGVNGDIVNPNHGLTPLKHVSNGTSYYDLLYSSPAVDTGGASCPSTDQIGRSRPAGSACDIGAIEGNFYWVNSTADTDDGACNVANCTLREAVNGGNANGGATILFDPVINGQTIVLASPLPAISEDITVDGTGHHITVDANNTGRVFMIVNADFTCHNLTLTRGLAPTGDVGGAISSGGSGFLTVDSCTITHSSALAGGAVYAGDGGALVVNSTFYSNTATLRGGAISGGNNFSIHNSTISDNYAEGYAGGVYFYFNEAGTMLNNIIYGNRVLTPTGNVLDFWGETYAGPDLGGGNVSGSASGLPGIVSYGDPLLQAPADNGGDTWTFALGSGSTAVGAGLEELTGLSSGITKTLTAPAWDQRGVARPRGCSWDAGSFEAASPCHLVVNTTTDTNDGRCDTAHCSLREAIQAINNGGGGEITFDPIIQGQTIVLTDALPVVITNTVVNGTGRAITVDAAGNGRIFDITGGDFTCLNLTLTNGQAPANESGGALRAVGAGFVTVDSCTFTHNDAYVGGAIDSSTAAGGYIVNSTFVSNTAELRGGAITGGNLVSLHNNTITDNTAGWAAGGAYFYFNEAGTMLNNIIYGNHVITTTPSVLDFWGETYAGPDLGAGNVTISASGLPGVASYADPLLQPLADNGGDTWTMALGAGSSAIDLGVGEVTGDIQGTPTTVHAPADDQRGIIRPVPCAWDAGAYEADNFCASPGGVIDDLGLWLKANSGAYSDGGTTPATDGTNVLQWHDQSGSNNIASEAQINATTHITYVEDVANFNPVVHFDGTADQRLVGQAVTGFDGPATIFVVAKAETQPADVNGLFSSTDDTLLESHAGQGLYFGTSGYIMDGVGAFESNSANTSSPIGNSYHLVTGRYAASGTTQGTSISLDGRLEETHTGAGAPLTEGAIFEVGGRTWYGFSNRIFHGDIAEIIYYGTDLTPAEQNQVESYLAVKYGITLSGTTAVSSTASFTGTALMDYVASDGTAVWSAADHATYYHDVAGVGYDAPSALYQWQSQSVNGDDPVMMQLPVDSRQNGLPYAYLLWGNDNGPLTYTIPMSDHTQMDRVWQVAETGSILTVTVSVPVSTNAGWLWVDDDTDFSNAVAYPLTARGNGWVGADVDFSDGQYFTFAEKEPVTYYAFFTFARTPAVLLEPVPAITPHPATTTGEVFASTAVSLTVSTLPAGGHFVLSSSPSHAFPVLVDDQIAFVLNGSDIFVHTFSSSNGTSTSALVELPRTVVEAILAGGVTMEYRDVFGGNVAATAVAIIWSP